MKIEKDLLISKHRGYEVYQCTILPDDYTDALIANMAYSLDGGFIGPAKEAALYDRFGIIPQKARPEDEDASIGWCEKERKWYAWGLHVIRGFGIGDEVLGEVLITDDMAKQVAIVTADALRGKLR